MSLQIDDLVYTKKGKRAMELAVVETIKRGDVRVGRFGTAPMLNKVRYTARYSDGETLLFEQGHIGKTVFAVK